MTIFRLLVFLFLLPVTVFSQAKISELKTQLQNAASDSDKIKAYSSLIGYYAVSNPDSAEYYGSEGITYSEQKKYKKGEASINLLLGRIDESQGRVDMAKKHIFNALQIYKDLNDDLGIADMYTDLGAIEGSKGNYDSAITYFIASLKLHNKLKNYKGQMITCSNLGSLYLQHDDTAYASKYLKIAEEASKKTPLMDQTITLYNTIGVLYDLQGNKPKALEYFLNDLKLSEQPGFVNAHIESLLYLGDYYIGIGDATTALGYLETGLKIATQENIPEMQSNILHNIALIKKDKDPVAAMVYLNKARSIAQKTQNRAFLITILKDIVDIYKQQGKYQDALLTIEEKQKLTDSLFNLNKSKELANITAAYHLETNERIHELEILSKKNGSQRNVIVFVAISLVIALIILSIFYRKTTRLNKQTQIHEKKLEELNAMKDKLFSVIGHDLRGPIARIPIILDMVQDNDTSVEERNFLINSLRDHAKLSLETFDKLLYWGRSLVKGIQLEQKNIKANSYIMESIELRKLKSAEKNIIIQNHTPPDLYIYSDASIFDFVMRNFLANALKYTPRNGKIDINTNTTSNPGYVVFSVKDSGNGIDKEKLSNIFYSLNSEIGTENEKGHGIGLMLCKEFAIQNGGDIWVTSEIGNGATFYFSVLMKQ